MVSAQEEETPTQAIPEAEAIRGARMKGIRPRKPVCAQCAAAEGAEEERVNREPPPKIERGRGRRPEVDTSRHPCPYEVCTYYGWLNRGNIIANGHPNGGRWRQLQCVVCGRYFQETVGTMFYGSSASTEDIIRALVALCEGVSLRKVARIFGVDKDTVLGWLIVASGHAEAVLGYVMHELELEQVQMDVGCTQPRSTRCCEG